MVEPPREVPECLEPVAQVGVEHEYLCQGRAAAEPVVGQHPPGSVGRQRGAEKFPRQFLPSAAGALDVLERHPVERRRE